MPGSNYFLDPGLRRDDNNSTSTVILANARIKLLSGSRPAPGRQQPNLDRHSGECQDPTNFWIPACAGKTTPQPRPSFWRTPGSNYFLDPGLRRDDNNSTSTVIPERAKPLSGIQDGTMMKQVLIQRGFSLIELVITIVVLGAIMAGSAAYITNSTVAYTNVAQRDQLTTLGRITIERVTRELRNALPNSIRIQNNCLEFFPVKAGSVYFDIPTNSPSNTFTAWNFTIPAGANIQHVVVYPVNVNALYNAGSPGPRAGFSGAAGAPTTTVTLSGNHRFALQAPHRRFFLAEDPVSYCIVGTNLNRYENYGVNAAQSTPPGGGNVSLMAQNIQTNDGGAVTPFTYTPGTLQRNGLVMLDFRFLIDGDWIRLSHEVQIRNVL